MYCSSSSHSACDLSGYATRSRAIRPALALSREASCFLIPAAILGRRQTRTVTGTVIASLSILVGMWLERHTIVVSTLSDPRVPWDKVFYFPS